MVQGERSIAAVLTDIVGNVQQIVRAEIRLATVEVREEAAKAARSAILVVTGGVIAVLAGAFALLACVYVLGTVVAPGIGARRRAAGAGSVGGTFIAVGMKRMQNVAMPPPRTMATIEENIQWAKTPHR